MADTTYSPQEVLNRLNGSAPTAYSEQAIANMQKGNSPTLQSWQDVLNTNAGYPSATSVQRALYLNLTTALSLTPADTQLSPQALLNRALSAGVSLTTVMTGVIPGGGGSTGQPVGLLLAITQA